MKIVIIGTGYVGLTTGLGFANLGHLVYFIDIDTPKINLLRSGALPFYDPALQSALSEQINQHTVRFYDEYDSHHTVGTVIFLTLPTPLSNDGKLDTSAIYYAIDQLANFNISKEMVIFIKSTVLPGTTEAIFRYACLKGLTASFVYNPEFLREGMGLNDFLNPERIVIGTKDDYAKDTVKKLYKQSDFPKSQLIFTDFESAELSKCLSNAFLATKISFINEAANLCSAIGANIIDIQKILASDSRIGAEALKSGIGYGGFCLPKDTEAIIRFSYGLSSKLSIIDAAHNVNVNQKKLFLIKIMNRFENTNDVSLTIWGTSFKRKTDSIRSSIAIDIIKYLYNKGFKLTLYDPKAHENTKKALWEQTDIVYANGLIDSLSNTNALLILTDWEDFIHFDFSTYIDLIRNKPIFDGRNCLDKSKLIALGIEYHGIGC